MKVMKKVFVALVAILAAVAVLTAVVVGAYVVVRGIGRSRLDAAANNTGSAGTEVSNNGSVYRFRPDVVTVLGISAERLDSGGGAEAVIFCVLDESDGSMTIVSIPACVTADITTRDQYGADTGRREGTLTQAYTQGLDDRDGSELTLSAVSRLMCGVPSMGWITLHTDGVSELIEPLGDVSLTLPAAASGFGKSGETVTFSGDDAEEYLFGGSISPDARYIRHWTFIEAFYGKATKAVDENPLNIARFIKTLKDNCDTDMDFESFFYLATQVLHEGKVSFINLDCVKNAETGGYTLDNDQVLALVLRLFYRKI